MGGRTGKRGVFQRRNRPRGRFSGTVVRNRNSNGNGPSINSDTDTIKWRPYRFHRNIYELRNFKLKPETVGDHGDEFAVGGLSPSVVDGIPEIGVEHVHIAAVPGNFNGMADRPLDAGRGSGVLFATAGYSRLVTALMMSSSLIAMIIASRRY